MHGIGTIVYVLPWPTRRTATCLITTSTGTGWGEVLSTISHQKSKRLWPSFDHRVIFAKKYR